MKSKLSRRQFIRQSAIVATVIVNPLGRIVFAQSPIGDLGLHLATVQDALAAHPQSTVEAIYQAGYRQIELPDTRLLPRLQPVFQSLNIAINSAHFLPPLITGNWNPLTAFGGKPPPADYIFERAVEQATEYGLSYLVFPTVYPQDRGGTEAYRELAEKLNKAGEVCQRFGIQLAYHHRAFEFHPMEDTSAFEIIMENTDPALLKLETDPFWLSVAGLDPASFMRDQADRIELLHLQDIKPGTPQSYLAATLPNDSFQPVGAGALDFAEILKAAREVGVAHYFVTQDQSDSPVFHIKQSAQYLKRLIK